MKEKIELNRYRELGDIISDCFVVIRQNFKPLFKAYFTICGLFLIVDIVISASVNADKGASPMFTTMGCFELLFDFINYTALTLTTLSYLVLYKEKNNQPPEVMEVWGYFRYYFFRVFVVQILTTIALVIAFFLCIAPSIYFGVVFALVTPIMVVENGSIQYSFTRAFKLISGNWWFSFGAMLLVTMVILLMMLVLMLPPMIFYGASEWLTGKSLDRVAGILQAVIINLCQLLWLAPIIASALLYFSLVEAKEAGSLLERIKMFGKNDQSTDQFPSEQY